MFRTKKDVDRHVTQILGRIKNDKERHSRGYQFAKLYHDVKDFDSAKRHLLAFLSVREAAPQAHKLLGQIYESLRDDGAAVESYKRSIDLDPDQKDLLLKVCELYGDPSLRIHPDTAKFWIERTEKYYPNHASVFRLKERIVYQESKGDTAELEHLISTQLEKNPADVQLHIKLLKLFLQSREVERAYEHVQETEKTLAFVESEEWYTCLAEIYQVYEDQYGCVGDTKFFTNKLSALATLAYLRLAADTRDVVNCVKVLHQFDMDLHGASQSRKHSPEWDAFIVEMQGQFFFLVGTLLLKRAQKGQFSWRDASSLSAVCYLISESLPTLDPKSSWFYQATGGNKKLLERLYQLGCYRLSQGGNIVLSMSRQDGKQWARKLRQRLCTQQGREQLYDLIFMQNEMRQHRNRSFLLHSDLFTGTDLEVPSKAKVLQYDEVAYSFHPSNLQELVWLALQQHSLSDNTQPDYQQLYGYQLFKDMKFSVKDLSSGDPGSLCQLDVQVFFYACVRWMATQLRDRKRTLHAIPDKPDLLPACLSQTLCSRQQAEWWSALYKMESKNSSEKLSKLWATMVRGLETIRLISPHTLPLNLIIHVAQTLDARAKEIELLGGDGLLPPKLAALQSRAGFYWRAAMEILDRNQSIRMPKECLFPEEGPPDPGEIREIREQVQFALALVNMQEENYEEALKGFENVFQPRAAYYTGLIFKKMAESTDANTNMNSARQHETSQQMALLSKSKTSFYQALDRLGTDKDEELTEAVKHDLDEVVCKMISAESGGTGLMDSILSNQNYSTAESDFDSEEEALKLANSCTPSLQRQARNPFPSPTRLEVQLKALETSQQTMATRMATLEEALRNNQKNTDLLQELIAQLRESREENKHLREQIQMAALQQGALGLGRPSMSGFPGTPQSRAAAMNQSFQSQPYDFPPVAASIPTHISQYGYGIGSPGRPSSGFGAPEDLEEELRHVDGEYYDGDLEGQGKAQFGVPDCSLVQEWPFGHKAGVEGKSTITYAPQARPVNPPPAGYFANQLRGPSIQYSNYQQPRGPASTMPGPGFFAQIPQQHPSAMSAAQMGVSIPGSQQMPGVAYPPPQQAGLFPAPVSVPAPPAVNQGQQYLMTSLSQSPALSPGLPQPGGQAGLPSTLNTPSVSTMMPPNAVASPSLTTKPRLIPGSVGVTPPPVTSTPAGKAMNQTVPPASSAAPQPASTPGTQPVAVRGSVGTTDPAKPFPQMTKAPAPANQQDKPTGTSGQGLSAASTLQALANKHQASQQKPDEKSAPAASATTPQKVGGFSFTSTPVIKDASKEERPKAVLAKPAAAAAVSAATQKPFSGFSFTVSSSSTAVTPTSSKTATAAPQAGGSPFTMGANAPVAALSFGSVAAAGATSNAFSAGGDSKGFGGMGAPVFKSPGSPRKTNRSLSEDDHVEEYEPNVDFQPVVPLPALVEAKTGEEDEEKLFGERAKLFRFDAETKQWKERGVGEMKILRNKISKKVRILMRREQVLKLCANHTVLKDMKLSPMSTSDRAWVWTAMDYSEEEMKFEKFAIRFKNKDSATQFKQVFEDCQAAMVAETEKPKDLAEAKAKDVKPDTKPGPGKGDLSKLFQKKEGSWTCDGCLITNEASSLKCPCCNTLKPGVKPSDIKETPASAATAPSGSGFKLPGAGTTSSASGFTFGSQGSADSGSSKPAGGMKFGSQAATPGTGFSFGGKPAADVKKEETGSGFSFGGKSAVDGSKQGQGSGFKFGSSAASVSSTAGEDVKSAGFAVEQKSGNFPFGSSAGKVTSSVKPEDTQKKAEAVVGAGGKPEDVKSSAAQPSALSKLISGKTDSSAFGLKPAAAGQGFTFGSSKPEGSGFVFGSPQTTKTEETSKPSGFVFGTPTQSQEASKPAPKGFDFKTPSKSASDSAFKFTLDQSDKSKTEGPSSGNFTFSMTPKTEPQASRSPGITSPKSPEVSADGYYMNKDGDDSHIHFEPVIDLPEKVPVKTGEEGEECLFQHRSKLFRFVNGEWKERGLGDIKILFCTETKKARVVMRREQILKICCNHSLLPEMVLKPMPNSQGKALIWFALDFADGEEKPEQFSARFKTAEIADDFQKAFENAKVRVAGGETPGALPAQSRLSFGTDSKPQVENVGSKSAYAGDDGDVVFLREERATPEEVQRAREFMLPDNFYLYTRKPDCPGCRGCEDGPAGTQDREQREEPEEDEDDDDYETEEEEETDEDSVQSDTGGVISPSIKSGTSYLAQLLSEGGVEEEQVRATGGFFTGDKGNPIYSQQLDKAGAEKSGDTGKEKSTEFVFGTGKEADFSFSALAAAGNGGGFGAKDSTKPFKWQGAGQQLFNVSGVQEQDSGDEDSYQDHDPHFEPVVPLPELIEVKTGEEDESAVFSQRAKLFRFDTALNQWKEKGIGEMKILRHKQTGKHRLLLRREQVYKLACNHLLTPDLKVSPMNTSETAWCWTAQDFSEAEPKVEQFAVRFKTIALAKEFKAKVDEIQQAEEIPTGIQETGPDDTQTPEAAVETVGAKEGSVLTRLLSEDD